MNEAASKLGPAMVALLLAWLPAWSSSR